MFCDDACLVEPLGARGADVVEIEHFEHRGAHDAQINGEEDQRQRQRRQHQMCSDIQRTLERRLHRADILEAAGG